MLRTYFEKKYFYEMKVDWKRNGGNYEMGEEEESVSSR